MKRILTMLAAIFIMFSFTGEASANNGSLDNIHSEAIINNDGTVDIEQTWVYDDNGVSTGTEHYINLNASYGPEAAANGRESITNYEVYRNGQKMTFDENWDINSSFERKADRYGVIEVSSSELELSFGISEYTLNEYTVKYKVHNVVKETTDGFKYLHWTFVPTDLDPGPRELTAEITTQSGMDINKVYGFNYEGQVGYVDDQRDRVYAEMSGRYGSSTTLNVFTLLGDTNNVIMNTTPVSMTLEKKAKQILKGSDYNLAHFNEDHFEPISSVKESWWKKMFNISNLKILIPFILFPIAFTVIYKNSNRVKLVKNMDKADIKKLTKSKDFYYRDEPDEVVYSTELIRSLMASSTMDNNILSYYISKWTSDGVFEHLGEEEVKAFFKTEKVISFRLDEEKVDYGSKLERELLESFFVLSNHENVLTTNDLKKLDMDSITYSIKKHKSVSFMNLRDLNYVDKERALTEDGQELIFQHAGLKNYLSDYTLINERSSSEIELWDYYFHMAALYGIADEFKSELKNIPNLSEEDREKYNRYYGTSRTASLANSVSKQVNNAYTSHNSSSSSSGGGGGSSGGGSGGGTR